MRTSKEDDDDDNESIIMMYDYLYLRIRPKGIGNKVVVRVVRKINE